MSLAEARALPLFEEPHRCRSPRSVVLHPRLSLLQAPRAIGSPRCPSTRRRASWRRGPGMIGSPSSPPLTRRPSAKRATEVYEDDEPVSAFHAKERWSGGQCFLCGSAGNGLPSFRRKRIPRRGLTGETGCFPRASGARGVARGRSVLDGSLGAL